jgi:cysteine desulfurase
VSAVEHPAVRESARHYFGARVAEIPVDGRGVVDLRWLEERRRVERPVLVAIMAANNETGVLQPLEPVRARCDQTGVHLHVDAAQVFMRLPTPTAALADSVAISAHKAGGPVGIGALWWGPATELAASQVGGMQERGARAGTEAVWLASAFAALVREPEFEIWSRLEVVRDAFEAELRARAAVAVNSAGVPRLPNTSNVAFVGRESEELLAALDLAGVAASAGSACTAGSIDPSPVLIAMGLDEPTVRGSVRFSFGPGQERLDGREVAARVLAAIQWPG